MADSQGAESQPQPVVYGEEIETRWEKVKSYPVVAQIYEMSGPMMRQLVADPNFRSQYDSKLWDVADGVLRDTIRKIIIEKVAGKDSKEINILSFSYPAFEQALRSEKAAEITIDDIEAEFERQVADAIARREKQYDEHGLVTLHEMSRVLLNKVLIAIGRR